MEQGLKSLRPELERSRADTVEEMNSVPLPQGLPNSSQKKSPPQSCRQQVFWQACSG
jgi:hypothetical protein